MSNEVRSNSAAEAIIAEEEAMHVRVQARVVRGTIGATSVMGVADLDRDLIDLRDQIAEAKPEDLAPLVEQMTRMAALRARLGGSRSLPVDIKSPYFAHMALREGTKTRDVLIGKRGFIDRQSNVQIVDWRNAPISQIYYRYDEGDDYEEEIAGRKVDGIVNVRRNVSIFGGKLRRIGAPQGTFIRDVRNVWHEAVGQAAPALKGGQGKAMRVPEPQRERRGDKKRGDKKRGGHLGVHHGPMHRADKALPEIAALIDREQFDLITEPDSGMVVIQGGAGSGKTTVALHRIAYLSFADSRRFRPDRMLFVVPSRSLAKYVAGVLPALGVRGVPVVTYRAWARNQRRKVLPGSGQKYNDDAPEAVTRVKKHPALLTVLMLYISSQAIEIIKEIVDTVGPGRAARATREQWQAHPDAPLVERLRQLRDFFRRSDSQIAGPARRAGESAARRLGRRAGDVLSDWAEILTDEPLLRAGFAEAGAGDIRDADIRATVAWCARQVAGFDRVAGDEDIATADGQGLHEAGDPGGLFDPEDDPILLRLTQHKRGRLITPKGQEIAYAHVAVDEAQDRSAIEIKVLLEATLAQDDDPARRSITIAGDTAQRLVFDNSFAGWEEMLASTGYAAVVRPLRLSYRSTAQVMAFARDVLGPALAPDEPLTAREGAPVELHAFGDIGEAVAFLADALRILAGAEPTASTALVARYPEQADAYYAGLARAEVPALRRVRGHNFSFTPGIDVTDVAQIKGLEFDYVIMVEVNAASYSSAVEARHLLHIGATRAAHQLWLVSTDTVSSLVPERLHPGGVAAV